jgi:hypothetical protein
MWMRSDMTSLPLPLPLTSWRLPRDVLGAKCEGDNAVCLLKRIGAHAVCLLALPILKILRCTSCHKLCKRYSSTAWSVAGIRAIATRYESLRVCIMNASKTSDGRDTPTPTPENRFVTGSDLSSVENAKQIHTQTWDPATPALSILSVMLPLPSRTAVASSRHSTTAKQVRCQCVRAFKHSPCDAPPAHVEQCNNQSLDHA